MSLPKIRPELLDPKLFRPDWTKSSFRKDSQLWLDKNENSDHVYIQFLKNIMIDVCQNDINNYPDCSLLYDKLSRHLNVESLNLLLAAGSDGIIKQAFETFVSSGDAVIYTDPTFAMYSVYSDIFGARSYKISYKKSMTGIFLDVELLLKTIYDVKPTLICLPNPDSPTGTLIHDEQLIPIIEAAYQVNSAILIDEAYYPFSEYTILPLINRYPNLIVMRTFSKAWGLAGARVGYAVSNIELISYMHKARPMYELGAISVAVALRVLDYENEMQSSVKRLNDGKNYFRIEMNKLGFKTLISEGNFQHVAFGIKADLIHAALNDIVLYRKDFPGTALEGYSRFSATTQSCFERIVQAIKSTIQHDRLIANIG